MRYTFLFVIFLAVMLFTAFQAQAASPMIISGNPDGPPVSWDKRDKLMGVGPEVAAKIMSELKVPFTMTVESSWQQVQDKAKSGAIDMIVSAYDNKERRSYMDYSIPYLDSPVVIVVKKGDQFPFSSWQSLIGKKVLHIPERVLAKNLMPLSRQSWTSAIFPMNAPSRCLLKIRPTT